METRKKKEDFRNMMIEQLFQSPEWIEIKTSSLKTDKVLTRIQFLKEIGWQEYTDEKYKIYLEAMVKDDFMFDEAQKDIEQINNAFPED